MSEDISLETFLGIEFLGYRVQDAVDKLRLEKHGHIMNALERQDDGMQEIALVWGYQNILDPSDGAGMEHIIFRRTSQGIDIDEFFKDFAEVVEKGILKGKNKEGRYEIWYNRKLVVLAPEYNDHKMMYLLTAFKQSKIGKPLQ